MSVFENEQVGRIVDTKLSAQSGKNKDVFAPKSPEIIILQEKLNQAEVEHVELRESLILSTFRSLCEEYKKAYGSYPTRALLNYRDVSSICRAYNEESRKKDLNRGYLSSSAEKIEVDGITIKQGCDQEPGQVRFYQFE